MQTLGLIAAALILGWLASHALLLIVAGLLFGVFLDALTNPLARLVPIGRAASLAIVCLALAGLLSAAIAWGGIVVSQQRDELMQALTAQAQSVLNALQELGLQPPGAGDQGILAAVRRFLPELGGLFGSATDVLAVVMNLTSGAIFVVLVGIFFAANPQLYIEGALRFVSRRHRAQAAAAADETLNLLRRWLIGQAIAMLIVGALTWLALMILGIPGATLLGIQAGLLNFIPYLGAFIAAAPIALAALSQGLAATAWVLGAYTLIQAGIGYLLAPLIQQEAIKVPPVLTLAALMVFGALFGALGVAVATPLTAVIRVVLLRFYAPSEK